MPQAGYAPQRVPAACRLAGIEAEALKDLEDRLARLRYADLVRPCTVGDGILPLSAENMDRAAALFWEAGAGRDISVFVAASGSASRLASSLRSADLPPAVKKRLRHLGVRGLASLAGLPKALFPFHRSGGIVRPPLEEHLLEASDYAASPDGTVHVHFTVDAEHASSIQDRIETFCDSLPKDTVIYRPSLSVQAPATRTPALDRQRRPLRARFDDLILKPGGHGALLTNLENLQSDIVYLRTVDNILAAPHRPAVVRCKAVLGGCLLSLENRIHAFLRGLHSGHYSSEALKTMERFAERILGFRIPSPGRRLTPLQRAERLYERFNRPLRVCGVTPRTGLPGGAPFWVDHPEFGVSCQLIDPPQVEPKSSSQRQIWHSSTHFNPVDIVCSVRDFRGLPFSLSSFVDRSASILVERTAGGLPVYILERPGLWNGGMAFWNTVIFEVPRETAAPVKSLPDLLHPLHQG